MDTANPAILCTKVDKHAGDWPSTSFAQLFVIAKKCVEAKLDPRPEIADVSDTLLQVIFEGEVFRVSQLASDLVILSWSVAVCSHCICFN